MAQVNKIDSNVTGLRYAEEESIGVLPSQTGTPATDNAGTWKPLEPNSYNDFGGQLALVARNPINDSRQRKKGVITDLDAAGGFNTDLTQSNLQDLLQGFFFASLIPKVEFGGGGEITGVVTATDDYQAASGLDAFAAGDLVFASGFTDDANNGLKTVSAASATALSVNENLVDETPGNAAKLVRVGVEAGSGDIDVDATGTWPALTSTTLDFTTLGLSVGEFVFVGGDASDEDFVNAENNGWKRVKSIAANRLEFDKSESTMVTETGTSITLRIFFGRVLKNRTGTNVTRRTYQLERRLGAPDDALPSQVQAEYLRGAIPNELTFQVNQADKLMADLSFVAIDHELYTGATTLKSDHTSATKPALVEADAFNTSSDFSWLKMYQYSGTDEAPSALFAYVTEMTLEINNNVTPNKAVAVLGAFDATAGTFEVGGSITAYFSNVNAISAVRNNGDITMNFAIAKANAGMAVDLPLIALGDGRANIEQDQPITIPLTMAAATGAKIDANMDHTLLMTFFDYLPTAAE